MSRRGIAHLFNIGISAMHDNLPEPKSKYRNLDDSRPERNKPFLTNAHRQKVVV